MVKTNIDWMSMSDKAVVNQIGDFIKKSRLAQNKTQSQIAEDAGVNRWTLGQIEKGEAINLTSFIQILRALHLLSTLNNMQVVNQISPIAIAKSELQKRKRARSKKSNLDNNQNKTDSEW